MELRQLEYFCMISKLENFTRAAELLHVSQPSVTKAIKNLEMELKVTLVDRSQKHVTLTPEGQAFLVHAEKILHAVDGALDEMSKFKASEQGVLRLGIPPMIEAYLFPDIFTKFRKQYPNIELNVEEYGSSVKVQTKLDEGVIDLGILLSGNADLKNTRLIMEDKLSLCVHNKHPLKDETSVNFGQLKQETFVLQHPNTHQYKMIYARCMDYDFTPNILLATSQLKTIKQLVANKSAVAVLMNLVTRGETSFTTVPIVPALTVHVLLAWSPNKCLSQAGKSFVNFLEEYVHSASFAKFNGK